MPVRVFYYGAAEPEIASQESNLAHTQITVHCSGSDSDDSTDHSSRSCCISGHC